MAIRTSINFLFDSISSEDMGLINVNVGTSGLLEEPFFSNRTINETKIRGRDKPYFSGITNDALTFTLSFAFSNPFDSDAIRAVARWLFTDYYKPLQFSDNLDRIYFAIIEGSSSLLHNGSQGYINLNVRCDSPYSYSPTYLSPLYDLSSNPSGGTTINISNLGDQNINPELYIEQMGTYTDLEIINLSNSGVSTKFSSAIADPTVAPVLSQVVNALSTLPATTYYGRYTYAGVTGETLVSPEVSFVLSSGYSLVMTVPPLVTNSSLVQAYIGTASGTGKLQGSTITTTYTQSIPLVSVISAPTVNTSGIKNLENLYLDCENELIISDQSPVVYRFGNFNNNFLELVYGQNTLLVKGNMILRLRYSYCYLAG